MMKLNYRRGEATGSGLMHLIFLIMVVMIVGGIYGGLIAFFGKGYDYRERESNVLSSEVRECLDKEKFDLDKLDKETFFEKCRLSKEVIEDGEHLIYIKDEKDKEFFVGVYDFNVRCWLNMRYKNLDFPLCKNGDINGYKFLVGSAQNSKRVAT